MPDTSRLPTIEDFWEQQSPTYDEAVDHGLTDPAARAAWAAHLRDWLPETPSTVLDLGCGTGSMDRLLLDAGHQVVGVDLAPGMLARARATCPEGHFVLGDASAPPVGDGRFDVLLARHLLWTLPDPPAVLARWVSTVRPEGRLVLVEGRGVRAEDLVAALDPLVDRLEVVCLSADDTLWGRAVQDERYAVVARLSA